MEIENKSIIIVLLCVCLFALLISIFNMWDTIADLKGQEGFYRGVTNQCLPDLQVEAIKIPLKVGGK